MGPFTVHPPFLPRDWDSARVYLSYYIVGGRWTSGSQSQVVLLPGRRICALPCCGRTERWMEIGATGCLPRGSIFSSLEQPSFQSPLRIHVILERENRQVNNLICRLATHQQGSPYRQSIRIALADLKMSGCQEKAIGSSFSIINSLPSQIITLKIANVGMISLL